MKSSIGEIIGSLPCWCGEGEWRVSFRTRRFGLVRCVSCGCYCIDPPPLRGDSESPSFYTDYYADLDGDTCSTNGLSGRSSRFWRVVRQVPELNRIGRKALDIGCGEGTLAAELSAAGWQSVAGLDVSRSRVFRARELYPEIDFYDQPLEETGIATGSIDLAVMDNVIEHLPSPATMLSTIRSRLNSEGRLIVITPNMESGHFRLLGRRWTQELAPHTHIFLFTDDSLRHLLAKAGFVVEASGNFHLPPYSGRMWLKKFGSADVKGLIWSAVQETGAFFGRLIGSGPMIYVVARVASAQQIANLASETCCQQH